MTTEEKFRAAVNVIRNLPKNGSYQPSHELMLRFYSYFKQATEGPCTAPRPAFWEVVKKMKWDAWTKLGNMSRDEAMNNYVEELKKIVETMSYTDNVATFLGSLGSFYDSVPVEDLELLIGDVIERVRSQPGSPLSSSPFASREASPHRVPASVTAGTRITSSLETSPASSYSASPLPPEPDDDEEEEEFIDTVEAEPERLVKDAPRPPSIAKKANHHINGIAVIPKNDVSEIITNGTAIVNGHKEHGVGEIGYGGGGGGDGGGGMNERGRSKERNRPPGKIHDVTGKRAANGNVVARQAAVINPPNYEQPVHDISDQIRDVVLHLQRDLDRVTARVRSLEVSTLSGSLHNSLARSNLGRPSWWPFADLSPRTFVFVVLWPLFLHAMLVWLQKRRATRI